MAIHAPPNDKGFGKLAGKSYLEAAKVKAAVPVVPEQIVNARSCAICLDALDRTNSCDGMCASRCEQKLCVACMGTYLDTFVASTRFVIAFPKCVECNGRLMFKKWKRVVSDAMRAKYEVNLWDTTQVRCPGCESNSSFLRDAVPIEERMRAKEAVDQLLARSEKEYGARFRAATNSFSQGTDTGWALWEVMEEKTEAFQEIFTKGPSEYNYEEYPRIACYIPDKERRASFLVTWLRKTKSVRTLCCGEMMCFACHRFAHEGPCAETEGMMEDGGSPFKICPSCNVCIEKTEGCSSVTCLCGETFDWNAAEEW